MKTLLVFLLAIIVVGISLVMIAGVLKTRAADRSENQKLFAAGHLPSPLPDGFYSGFAEGYSGSWRGKKFDVANSSGINLFDRGGTNVEQYPFRTYVGKGVRDTNLDVLKIDYDIPENPWWLRLFLDEVVEISPGLMLGKLHVRILPGMPFTLGYFRLQR